MRILFLSQYFTPEVTASRVRVHAFAAGLAARPRGRGDLRGPQPPDGVVHTRVRRALVDRRELDGFRGHLRLGPHQPREDDPNRLLLYGTYAASAAAASVVAAAAPT